jgi:hypothetical protein
MILTGPTIEDAVGGHWIAVCIEEDRPNGVRLAAYRDNYRTRPRAIAYKNFLAKTYYRIGKMLRLGAAYGTGVPSSSQLPPQKYKLLHLKVTIEKVEDLI